MNRAADLLTETLGRLCGDGDTGPIVLSGSVLVRSAPVRAAVLARVAARWPDAPIHVAAPAEVGAARLAASLVR